MIIQRGRVISLALKQKAVSTHVDSHHLGVGARLHVVPGSRVVLAEEREGVSESSRG
jgi:hypothetical protein